MRISANVGCHLLLVRDLLVCPNLLRRSALDLWLLWFIAEMSLDSPLRHVVTNDPMVVGTTM